MMGNKIVLRLLVGLLLSLNVSSVWSDVTGLVGGLGGSVGGLGGAGLSGAAGTMSSPAMSNLQNGAPSKSSAATLSDSLMNTTRADASGKTQETGTKNQDAANNDLNKQDVSEKEAKKQDALDKEKIQEKDPSLFKNEFQDFVAQSIGKTLPLFGYSLFKNAPSTFSPVENAPVTPNYIVAPGDELSVRVWGQVEANLNVIVDRNGQINLPNIGSISVAGVAYSKLSEHIGDSISAKFNNFQIDVSMGKLHSIQLFVVGQAVSPGSYTVSSMSTLVNAIVASGGPSARGSMRHIQLKRGNKVISDFDLYDFLIKGDKSKDVRLLAGDVIYFPPVGAMVAISGSVNNQAIFELKANDRLSDVLKLAGGLTNVAATQAVTVERIYEHTVRKVDEFQLDKQGLESPMRDGDVISIGSISQRFDNAVKLQGAVAAPMRYIWKEGMRVSDLLKDNNSLIPAAYWSFQNSGAIDSRHNKNLVNWDYAVVQRMNNQKLSNTLVAFNLGKAISGDAVENMLLQPGDVVTIFEATQVLPKAENEVVLKGGSFFGSDRRFVWRDGMRIKDLIPSVAWLSDYIPDSGEIDQRHNKTMVNWDYAVVQHRDEKELVHTLFAFNLRKAINGDAIENMALQPGDFITIYSAEAALPTSEKEVVLKAGRFFPSDRHFAWREGMRVHDLIPSVKWLADYIPHLYDKNLSEQQDNKGVNWDYAVVKHVDEKKLKTSLLAFNLIKAIKGDPVEDVLLQPGEIIAIFAADEELPKAINSVSIKSSAFRPVATLASPNSAGSSSATPNSSLPTMSLSSQSSAAGRNSQATPIAQGALTLQASQSSPAMQTAAQGVQVSPASQGAQASQNSPVQGSAAAQNSQMSQTSGQTTTQTSNSSSTSAESTSSSESSSSTLSYRRFVWHEGMRIKDLIPSTRWFIDSLPDSTSDGLYNSINWGYARILRSNSNDIGRKMLPFSLEKAIAGRDADNKLLLAGDEITIFTSSEVKESGEKVVKYVTLAGEVKTPGTYPIEHGETLRQLISRVGGFTPLAHLRSGVFTRESIRQFQQKNLDEALRKFTRELTSAENKTSTSASKNDEMMIQKKIENQHALLESLRDIKATGRIVLELPEENAQLVDMPDLPLEDGDQFSVSTVPTTVSVVGAVYNQSTFMYRPDRALDDYLEMAGGSTKDADDENIYLVLADGTVKTNRSKSLFSGGLRGSSLHPGDLVFIPQKIDIDSFSVIGAVKDVTQIFYQLMLGAAGGKAAKMW